MVDPGTSREEELRRVAEDIRTLARSLTRDIREASRSAHGSTRSAGAAFREGVRDAARDARAELERDIRNEFGRRYGRYRHARSSPPLPRGWSPAAPDANGTGADPAYPPSSPSWPGPPPARTPEHRRAHEPVPPVRRRWDGPVIVSVVAAVLAGAWLLSAVGVLAIPAEPVLAVALMLLGAAVVVSARTDWSLSRHAWPVVIGFVLIGALFATSSSYGVGGAFTHPSIGSRTVSTTGGTVYGGIGQLTVDAQDAPPGSVVDVRALAGSTVIDPPANYVFEGRVLAGQVCDGRQSNSGIGAAETVADAKGLDPVIIDVHQLTGQVRVGTTCGSDR